MSDPVTAIVGSTVASVGGSLLGGSQAADAASSAADTQSAAARYAAELQYKTFQKQTELQEPFRQAGLSAQNQLLMYLGIPLQETRESIDARLRATSPKYASLTQQASRDAEINREINRLKGQPNALASDPRYGSLMRDFSMQDFEADPGYGFRISEGLKALDRTAAARGGLLSGAALRGAQEFGQQLGSQEYQNAFNRYQINRANKLQPLQSLMGAGQTAANTLSSAAGQYGQNAAEAAYQGANARASGYVGSANAWNQALGGATNAIGQGVGMYNFMRPTAPVASYGYSSVPGTTGVGAFL